MDLRGEGRFRCRWSERTESTKVGRTRRYHRAQGAASKPLHARRQGGVRPVRILPETEDERDFDGEAHIESNVSGWDSRDLVLLDPFAMWRQDQDQHRRNRYRKMVECLIARGQDSPLLILFWTWGRAFPVAEGDLADTNSPVDNGYQQLRRRLHGAGRHFIRVSWRWGLQFAMWVLVPDSHLSGLCSALQLQCNGIRDHLLRRGCGERLSSPDMQIVID